MSKADERWAAGPPKRRPPKPGPVSLDPGAVDDLAKPRQFSLLAVVTAAVIGVSVSVLVMLLVFGARGRALTQENEDLQAEVEQLSEALDAQADDANKMLDATLLVTKRMQAVKKSYEESANVGKGIIFQSNSKYHVPAATRRRIKIACRTWLAKQLGDAEITEPDWIFVPQAGNRMSVFARFWVIRHTARRTTEWFVIDKGTLEILDVTTLGNDVRANPFRTVYDVN
ncbi:MAG: hypothetical protein MI757_12655 [Pirellulales bacterium]|nr:hypothetical protein [Pirellulales bacterium]